MVGRMGFAGRRRRIDVMSDDRKPYQVDAPILMGGDPVGWVDRDGAVHVERFKSMGPHGIAGIPA